MNISKFTIYFRLTVIILVIVIVLTFMGSNFKEVEVKFLNMTLWRAPLCYLMFAMANLGILVFLFTRRIRKIITDIKQLRKEEAQRKKMLDQIEEKVNQKASSKP